MCDREKRRPGEFINLSSGKEDPNERDRVEQAATPLGLNRKKKDDGRH